VVDLTPNIRFVWQLRGWHWLLSALAWTQWQAHLFSKEVMIIRPPHANEDVDE
jgi:hypothetical protein